MCWLPAGSQVQCLRLPLVVAYPTVSLLWWLQATSVRTLAVMLDVNKCETMDCDVWETSRKMLWPMRMWQGLYLALYCNASGFLISGMHSPGLFSSNALNLHSRDSRFETRLRKWTSWVKYCGFRQSLRAKCHNCFLQNRFQSSSQPIIRPNTMWRKMNRTRTNKSDTINVPVMPSSKCLLTFIPPFPESSSCFGLTSNSGRSFLIFWSFWRPLGNSYFFSCQMMVTSMTWMWVGIRNLPYIVITVYTLSISPTNLVFGLQYIHGARLSLISCGCRVILFYLWRCSVSSVVLLYKF
jgi:hypothetical protein